MTDGIARFAAGLMVFGMMSFFAAVFRAGVGSRRGSVMAIGLLGEELHLYHIVGYALVFAGVVIAARKPKQA